MKLIGRIEPVMHLQGRLNAVPGGVFAPGDEADIEYIVRDENGVVVPSELVEEESNARTKILQLLEAIGGGGSLTDEEIAEIEAEVNALLNETDPAELGNLSGFSIVNKIRLAQTYRDDVVSAMEAKGVVPEENQPFRTVADLVEQFNLQEKTAVPTNTEQKILPDKGFFGLGAVMIPSVPDALPNAEGATFCTDSTLPEIPEDVLATYPKAVMFRVTSANSEQIVFIASESEFYHVDTRVLGQTDGIRFVGSLGAAVKSTAISGTWGDRVSVAAGSAGLPIGTSGDYTYSIVWANHDVYDVTAIDTTTEKFTTGAVYFARSSGSLGNKLFYNGVLLPEIPADVLATYPYAVMAVNKETMQYQLLASKQVWFSDGTSITNKADSSEPFLYAYVGDDSWKTGTSGNYAFTIASRPLIWSNHNIPKGSATATSFYFAGSEPIPESEYSELYQIQRETIDGIGEQVNRLCKTEEPMTPARMTEKLQDLSFDLQEITVTATNEQQTIYPDGCYGFSRIIVEAVEDSGTSGGGGTPGTGGGEGEDEPENKYPSAEDSELTYAQTMMKMPTGRFFYGDCPQSLPACPVKYSNQVFVYTSGNSQKSMYQCAVGFYHHEQPVVGGSPSYTIRPRSFPQICARYNYNSETDSWDFAGEANTNYIVSTGCYWSNQTILTNYDSSVYMEGTSPVPETEYTTTYAPTATDAMYTITGDTMTDLGATVYHITGEQATTPEAMIAALNYYAALNKPKEETTE